MSVRLRLSVTFLILMGLFLVPVRYAGVRLNDLREMAVERRSQHAAATLALGAFRAGLADFDSHQRGYLVTFDTRMGQEVHAATQDLMAQIDRLEAAGYSEAAQPLATALDSLVVLSEEIDRLVRLGEVETATLTFQSMRPLRAEMADELERIATAVDQASAADFARAEEMSATAATTTIGATVAAVVLALLVSAWTTGALTGPLRKLSRAAAQVEDGALEEPEDLPYGRSDEIGDLSRSFRAMTSRLAELDRMKAEFMSVASHELKTPISVIRGYTELIEYELADTLTERQAQQLEAIAEQTDVMVRLVSRLLDIGRLEAGAYGMEVEEVHVEDLIGGLVRSFDVLAREQEVELRTEIDPTAPATIQVDPDLLRSEVLGNLVSNALRFSPAGGEVLVRVWQEQAEERDEVVLEVSDTGPGVPEDQRPHIFEKYYEGGRTRSVGAGLGLAVAKEVAEAHGGHITLEPPGNRGATFRVHLPVAPRDET